jgi:hypothetical protein
MRSTWSALLTSTMLVLAACGGETPAPQPAPAPPPPPPATASATASADTTPPPPPPKPVLSEVIPQAIKGLFEAFNAQDQARAATYEADQIALYFYGSLRGGETHGKADVAKRVAATSFPDSKVVPTRIWFKGNVAVVEFTFTGLFSRDAGDIKATNKPMGTKRAGVYVFDDDGLVKEERIYADIAAMRAQMRGDKGAPAAEPTPTADPEAHVAKGTPDEDKLVDWARKIDDTFSTDDVRQASALLADDVQYDAWGVASLKGKKDVSKALQAFFKAFPDQKWAPTNVWGIDGYVVIEHVFTGTQKGPFGLVAKPTGKPITGEHFLSIWQPTPDGKLAHVWNYANPIEAMQQTGAQENGGRKPDAQPAAKK